jgi:hypothetical protein
MNIIKSISKDTRETLMVKLPSEQNRVQSVMFIVLVILVGTISFETVGVAPPGVHAQKHIPTANSPMSQASQALKERTDTCIDFHDGGPGNWAKGYHDAQNDFFGKGFDDSTNLGGEQASNYKQGYNEGWKDAQNGVTQPDCQD